MEVQLNSSNPSLEIRHLTEIPTPDNDISQKLSIKFFDFISDYLKPQDLKAVSCLDKYWNRKSIYWLNSQEICCSFRELNGDRNEYLNTRKWLTAIQSGDLETIRTCVETNQSFLELHYDDNDNACHLAVIYGHAHLVAYFHAHPKNLMSHLNKNGFSPFHLAIVKDKRDIVKLICEKDKDLSILTSTTAEGLNGLQLAACTGCQEIFEIIHSYDPDLIHAKFASQHNRNMLHLAMIGKNPLTINWIVDNFPAQISESDDKDIYPVHSAIQLGNLDAMNLLHSKNSSLITKNTKGGTALHLACYKTGSFEIFKILYYKYPGMRMIDDESYGLPFHLAIRNNHLDVVKFYTSKHPGILKKKSLMSLGPLHVAETRETAELLYKLDPSLLREKCKWNPLHIAASNGRLDVLKFYLECAPDLFNAKDNSGNILHGASITNRYLTREEKEGQIATIRYLIKEYPQLLDDPNSKGELPYKLAQESFGMEITLEMLTASVNYRKNLANKPSPQQVAPPPTKSSPIVEKTKEKKAGLPPKNNTKVEQPKRTSNAYKKEKEVLEPQPAQPISNTSFVRNDNSLNIEKAPINTTIVEERKEEKLPQKELKVQIAPSPILEESDLNNKPAMPETEPAVIPRTKKSTTLGRMRSKAVSAWNNTVGMNSAEKTRRREERKLLHRESISVSQSDWSRTIQSEWSQTIQSEVSEVEKSLAEGKYEPLVCAILKDSGIKLDQEIILKTLDQLQTDGTIEVKYGLNKIRATFLGECQGKRPSLTIHTHNHDKPWYEQYKVQYNFLTFIKACGLDIKEIEKQFLNNSKNNTNNNNNTNDDVNDAGEG